MKKVIKKASIIIGIVVAVLVLDSIQALVFDNSPFIKVRKYYNGGDLYYKDGGLLVETYCGTNGNKDTVIKGFSYSLSDDTYDEEYKNRKTNELFDITTEPYSSDTVKIVTEKEAYSIEDKVIKYSITNTDDKEHSIAGDSDCFSLHMLVDGEWKRVGTKSEHYWNSLAQILNPNQTEQREIDLDEYFNLPLEKGTYRIAVENLASNTFKIS